jgi:hypothetical protein
VATLPGVCILLSLLGGWLFRPVTVADGCGPSGVLGNGPLFSTTPVGDCVAPGCAADAGEGGAEAGGVCARPSVEAGAVVTGEDVTGAAVTGLAVPEVPFAGAPVCPAAGFTVPGAVAREGCGGVAMGGNCTFFSALTGAAADGALGGNVVTGGGVSRKLKLLLVCRALRMTGAPVVVVLPALLCGRNMGWPHIPQKRFGSGLSC